MLSVNYIDMLCEYIDVGSGCVQGCPARNAYRAGTGSIQIPQVVRFYFASMSANTGQKFDILNSLTRFSVNT